LFFIIIPIITTIIFNNFWNIEVFKMNKTLPSFEFLSVQEGKQVTLINIIPRYDANTH
jgi:hypothetical protein